ncbi:hypothetical protein [Mucilaginibacter sp. UYCu711]|uniref:hypothetical protein n=1 Tax=Mucilaginibacter sp. UYCu711 TaxID=3156339 RepID=UPI003D1D6099
MNVNYFLQVLNARVKIFSTVPVKLLLIGTVLLLFAFVPRDTDPLVRIVAVLQKWTDTIPQEKVYIQTDKPYYALGDTIWFKGYVTIGSRHQLSALSGALYVELVTEKDSIIRSLKLPITSGMVMGDFTLGDDFKEGSYRIRAYTQWMRNAGEEYFFDHTFTVGNLVTYNITTKADYQYKIADNKPVLTALLNYATDEGKPIAGKSITYQIVINKKTVWTGTAKTDAQGTIPVKIANDGQVDLAGAYIHTTLDGSNKQTITRDFPIKASPAQSDVQFFPESGNLVNGISSRVAFKAVGVDGLGIPVTGKIVDETNTEVAPLVTLHAGMGSFILRPVTGKTYTANISFPDGTTKTIALPKAIDEGYVLSVYQPNKDSVLVRIRASVVRGQNVSFIVHSSGETIFSSPVKVTNAITSVWLNKQSFPTGIAQFTLFDATGEPLNERIAFIRSNDQMQLNLKTARGTYKSKERVQVELDAMDSKGKGVPGNFSVTVVDESKVPMDESAESTIFSNVLLTSDLKGYIEKPNYYFTNDNDEVNRALDNLMLTQGYRRFTWKELEGIVNAKPAFPVEGLGFNISGKVTTLGGKLLPDAKVSLVSLKAGVMKGETTDAEGRFKFGGIFLTDSVKFAVQARTAKGSDKVKIILDSIPKIKTGHNKNIADISTNISGMLKAYLDNGKKEDDIYEQTGQLDKVHRLREVRIRARKITPPVVSIQGDLKVPEGHAEQTIIIKNAENAATIATLLAGELRGVIFKTYQPVDPNHPNEIIPEVPMYPFIGGAPLTIIEDGRRLDPLEANGVFDNTSLQPTDLVKVELVKMLSNAWGTGPALLLYTNRGMLKKFYNPGLVNINPKGFNKAREFYSPRYDRPGNADKLPDLRTTVYWNPYLKTDANGKTAFNFFNADGPGTYKVIVEGINADGELGRQVYRYTVNGDQADAANFTLPAADKSLAQITAPLDSFNRRLPVEKVYLHTDKPYYNIGDTLWFKSYLLDRVNLTGSRMSGLLYVELDNDSSEMVRRISIPIKDGLGWGQIPLIKAIFKEGGYTLRAYTNWMQNFGEDYVFSQRFYLGIPAEDAWLVKSAATVSRVADKDQLQVELKLNKADKLGSPVAIKKVEVKIYDQTHYLYKEELQTGIDGSLKFSHTLKDKADGRRIRVQLTSLEKEDNNKIVQVPLSINRNQNIDVQFLPEGGSLVNGLKSTVGFKAIAEDGRGTPVLGSITDGKGNEIVSFSSLHNGMGSFEFTPQAGETYITRISKPIAKSFELPKISATGTVMHLINNEQDENIKVNLAGMNTLATDSACYLIGTSRGVVYYSQKVELNQTEIAVAKKLFPSGITRFTLFKGKTPLNERIIFIDNNDGLKINVIPNKKAYLKRDSVGLEIEVKDKSGSPVKGSFSMAVTDDSQVKADSLGDNSIAANLLLNADLRGHVESPGYYINRTDKQAWQALDNLMLTQGWTGYEWKDVFNAAKPPKFEAEKDFKITGKVTDLFNKPVKAGFSVLISSQKPTFTTTTYTDEDGRYLFKKLPTIDSGSFFLQAKNAKGKNMTFGNVSIDKFKAPAVPETLRDPILPWYVNPDTTQINYVKRTAERNNEKNIKLNGIVLKEVKIKGKKIIKDSFNRNGAGNADLSFDEQDIKESAVLNLYQLLKQKLPGLKIVDEHRMPTLKLNNAIVVIHIDGGGLDLFMGANPTVDELQDELSQYQIATFKGMEVYYSEKNMVNYLQPRGYWINAHFTGQAVALSEDTLLAGKWIDDEGNPWGLKQDSGWIYKVGYKAGYLEARANVLTNKTPDFASIDITTKNGNGWFKNKAPSTVTYRPLPVMYPQQFYSPKYNVAPGATTLLDYRATLYWEPNIITDQNGKAKVYFYTSDINNKYTIKIAGVDVTGAIGDGTFKIKN